MSFEDEFTNRYLKVQSYELTETEINASRIKMAATLAEALIELHDKSNVTKKFEQYVIDYMDIVIESLKQKERNASWIKSFFVPVRKYLKPVSVYLKSEHGYISTSYIPNIIGGLIMDMFLILFGIYFPFMTLLMVLIKYFVIRYKRNKGKLLHY